LLVIRIIQKGKKKLQNILLRIKEKTAVKDVYSSENYNNGIENVTAIKFKGRRFDFARQYKILFQNNLVILPYFFS
jgi:hypothetical protein